MPWYWSSATPFDSVKMTAFGTGPCGVQTQSYKTASLIKSSGAGGACATVALSCHVNAAGIFTVACCLWCLTLVVVSHAGP